MTSRSDFFCRKSDTAIQKGVGNKPENGYGKLRVREADTNGSNSVPAEGSVAVIGKSVLIDEVLK